MIEYDTDRAWRQLLEIMETLRSPGGCPWDRVQTHQSIRGNLIEECYEAVDAIDRQDTALLREELGDVLLQVVFHAQIEREEGRFDIGDVLRELCEKLIVRHEHVFGQNKAQSAQDAHDRWDAVKKRTKGETTDTQRLQSIPKALPALMRTAKLRKRAQKAGYPLSAREQKWDMPSAGEALFTLAGEICRAGIDPEQALDMHNEAFIREFSGWEKNQPSAT
jgi:tetrapyrrole methylase family protein/MazG family protein